MDEETTVKILKILNNLQKRIEILESYDQFALDEIELAISDLQIRMNTVENQLS